MSLLLLPMQSPKDNTGERSELNHFNFPSLVRLSLKKKPLTSAKKLNDLPLIILKTLIVQTQMHSAVAVAYKPAVAAVVEVVAYVLFHD